MNKPNYIETKLQEFKEHFVNPDPTSSADQFKPELRGKLYSEFEAFLTQALEEQAAGLFKGFEEIIGYEEKFECKCNDGDHVYCNISRNSLRTEQRRKLTDLREQLKGMRGK